MLLSMGEAGGDIADWGDPVSGDSFGYGAPGEVGAISPTDIREMNVLGYNYTAGFNPTNPTHQTSAKTTNSSGQTVETVKVYSYGALAGIVTVTFGTSSASVTVSSLNGGASHTYTVAGDPSILFNVNGASTTILSGTSTNKIIIGDDNAKASGGAAANLIIGLGVDAVLIGAGTSDQFTISTPDATVTTNKSTFDMASNSCLDLTGNANTVNCGTAANDVVTVNDPGGVNQDKLTINAGTVVLATAASAVTITGTGNLVGNATGITGSVVSFVTANNTALLTKGTVNVVSNLTESVNGAGNTVNATGFVGDTIKVNNTGATADQVNMASGTLALGTNAYANLSGDHDKITMASGDSVSVTGQGETITGATKTYISVSDGGAAADTITVSGDNTGKSSAGKTAGINIAAGVATVTGTNDAITLGASAEVLLASTTGDTVAGLSSAGTNSIDLTTVAFNSADKTKFTPTSGSPTTGGTLQILNGSTVVASISLVGNYTTASFALSGDGGGHTLVKDPTTSASVAAPSVAAMVQAMAALTPDAAAISPSAPLARLNRLEATFATPRA
jgi:hypothetical protein